MKGFGLIWIIVGVLVLGVTVGGGAYFAKLGPFSPSSPQQTACTMEAKICPDGSSVGRTGPSCEFTACPADKADETANWKTFTSSKYSFSVKYPDDWETYTYPKSPNDPSVEYYTEQLFRPLELKSAEVSISVLPISSLSVSEKGIESYTYQDKKAERVLVDGASALKVSGLNNGKKNVAVVFGKGDYMYAILSLGAYGEMAEKILSTFKFL